MAVVRLYVTKWYASKMAREESDWVISWEIKVWDRREIFRDNVSKLCASLEYSGSGFKLSRTHGSWTRSVTSVSDER
jgi:hypothetical protein